MAEVDAYLKLPPQRWESEFRIRHRDGFAIAGFWQGGAGVR